MNQVFSGTRDEQSKLLDDALQAVKVQAFQMKRCVDNDRLMDGLKHCSTMLNELRTSSLTPKNYYELYLAAFDALQYLTGSLRAAHLSGKNHLADLYELVQYAGNIVPRIYLMITIGSTYMSLAGALDSTNQKSDEQDEEDEVVPVREIMMDMLEMARGVQHPTRGLFLRYYLGQMTKDYLPLADHQDNDGTEENNGAGGTLSDSTHFILTNFVEMNKLWVRLQHQGLSRDKERREAERRDLRTLVGSNLLRLAALNGVKKEAYEETILPRLLNQVVSCRDALAQEYLMEALVQAFSDEWHLATIGQLMESITGLGPKVSIKTIVIPLVDRVSAYASRRREEREKGLATPPNEEEEAGSGDGNDRESTKSIKSHPSKTADLPDSEPLEKGADDVDLDKATTQDDSKEKEDEDEDEESQKQDQDEEHEQRSPLSVTKPDELDTLASLFGSFWNHVSGLIDARPDLPIHDAVAICAAMLRMSLACNPEPAEPVDNVLGFVRGLLRARELSPGTHSAATANQLLALLLGPLRAYASPLKILALQNYAELLEAQTERTRRSVSVALLTAILQREAIMKTPDEVTGITRLCAALINRLPDRNGFAGDDDYDEMDDEELSEEQGLLARLVHLAHADDAGMQLELLAAMRDAFSQGNSLIRFTYPAVVAGAAKLFGPYASLRPGGTDEKFKDWLRRVKQLCRFIQTTVTTLVDRAGERSHTATLSLQLCLMAAQAAAIPSAFRGEPSLEEATYEFFVLAFTVYEEHISESRAQYQALVLIINALHASRNLAAENYETLVAKCVQHGSRLLKRTDQARIAYSCAQLWWKTLPDAELIPPPTEEGQDPVASEQAHNEKVERERAAIECHNNGDKVLTLLQRALQVADSCLDPVLSVRLFVELLSQYSIHYERRCLAVTPKLINDLIDLIRTSISSMEAFDTSAPEPTRATSADADAGVSDVNALYLPPPPMTTYVLQHFRRTLDYIQSRKDLAASGELDLPDFSAIHCNDNEASGSSYNNNNELYY